MSSNAQNTCNCGQMLDNRPNYGQPTRPMRIKIPISHHPTQVGWANVVFVDGHVSFEQATHDAPDFQNGDGWTFTYNGQLATP
jgi:prepilin-type processing-associated H-X9-DG protein